MYLKKYSCLNKQELRQHFYKELFKKEHIEWEDSMVLLTNWFNKYTDKNSSILDVGCGNGNWVIDELKEKFTCRIGVDLDKRNTKKNTSLQKILYGSIDNTEFKNSNFDCAVSLWALEHLDNPKSSFLEIYRILKPGGIFGFCTPNKNFFLLQIKNLIPQSLNKYILQVLYGRKNKDIFKTFYRANTKKDIYKICKNTGFEVIRLKENFDPSYTSYNKLTYTLSKLLFGINFSIFKAHIIGIVKKI